MSGFLSAGIVGGPDIPDSVVDNYEDTPDGVYGSSDTLADYYNAVVDFARTTTNVPQGSIAVEVSSEFGGSDHAIVSNSGQGLNNYPQPGETLRGLVRDPGADGSNRVDPVILFSGSYDGGTNTVDCYGVRFSQGAQFSDGFEIVKYDGTAPDGSNVNRTSLAGTNIFDETSQNEWYWIEADVPPDSGSNEGDIAARLYETSSLNPPSRGGQIRSEITATDTDFVSNTGVGFGSTTGSATGTCIDALKVI